MRLDDYHWEAHAQGERRVAGHLVARAVSAFLFLLYLALYSGILMLYGRGVWRNRDNFFVSLRVPTLLLLEAACNWVVMAITCCRQVVIEMGRPFPCAVSRLAMHLMIGVYGVSYLVRSVKLVVSVDADLRKHYLKRLTPRNVHLIVGLAAVACVVMWGGTYDIPLCHARCMQPSCFPGADWYLVLAVALPLHVPSLLLLGRRLLQLKLVDVQGLIVEMMQGAQVVAAGGSLYILLLVLFDYHIMSYAAWGSVVSALLVIILTLLFLAGGLVPAVRYGYDPFFSRRDRVASHATPSREMLTRMHTHLSRLDALAAAGSSSNLLGATLGGVGSPLGAEGEAQRQLLNEVLEAAETRALFVAFCRSAGCEESVLFLLRFRALAKEDLSPPNRGVFRQLCVEMVDSFLRPGCQYVVDLGSASLQADKLVHKMKLFQKRDVVFKDECLETLHGLQDVHDCLEKKLLRSSVLPNFRQSMEYRAFIQLQAQNTARRSSGGDDPNGKQHTQGPGLPFSDIADALLSSTTNQLLLAPPPPPRPEQEEEEETSKMEQQPQPQTPLASPSAPLSPVSPSSPTHPGSLRRSRSTRKVSMVGQGSFNCDNGVDAMAYAALMDANATSPKARGDEGRDTDVEAGTAPTSPVILGSRDLRRLSPMNRSQSASRIVVSSPVNINMSQARQSLITQQAQQQLQQDGHDGSPSARLGEGGGTTSYASPHGRPTPLARSRSSSALTQNKGPGNVASPSGRPPSTRPSPLGPLRASDASDGPPPQLSPRISVVSALDGGGGSDTPDSGRTEHSERTTGDSYVIAPGESGRLTGPTPRRSVPPTSPKRQGSLSSHSNGPPSPSGGGGDMSGRKSSTDASSPRRRLPSAGSILAPVAVAGSSGRSQLGLNEPQPLTLWEVESDWYTPTGPQDAVQPFSSSLNSSLNTSRLAQEAIPEGEEGSGDEADEPQPRPSLPLTPHSATDSTPFESLGSARKSSSARSLSMQSSRSSSLSRSSRRSSEQDDQSQRSPRRLPPMSQGL